MVKVRIRSRVYFAGYPCFSVEALHVCTCQCCTNVSRDAYRPGACDHVGDGLAHEDHHNVLIPHDVEGTTNGAISGTARDLADAREKAQKAVATIRAKIRARSDAARAWNDGIRTSRAKKVRGTELSEKELEILRTLGLK
jgi:hypothetical protein